MHFSRCSVLHRCLGGALLALAFFGPLAPRAAAQTGTVIPIVNEVVNHYDQGNFGKLTVTFGYVNTGADIRVVQYSASNFFAPEPSVRRVAPTVFLPGVNMAMFSTTFDSNTSAYWRLLGQSANVDINTDPDGGGTLSVFGGNGTITHTAERVVGTTRFELNGGGTIIIADAPFSAPIFENLNGTVRLTGSTLTAATRFDNAGILRFEGGALDTPILNNTGRVEFVSGNYTLPTLNNRGLLVVSGGEVTSDIALALGSDATLRLAGGKLTVAALEHTGGHVDLAGGTLVLTAQDLIVGPGGPLGANPTLGTGTRVELTTGRTEIAPGHTLTIGAGASLLTQGGANDGTLHVSGGTFESASGAFTNQSGATLNATSATLTFTGNGTVNAGYGLHNFGTLNLLNTTVHGDVHSPTGSTINAGGGVTFTGFVSGAGQFTGGGTVTFAGGYSPGDSPALVAHAGDLTLGAGNALMMEIAGFDRGTGYDALDVAGSLTFGGTLEVVTYGAFTPASFSAGQSFDLFNWGSATGTFSTLNLPDLSAYGLAWDTSALYTNGVLSVTASAIPEPSTYAALAGLAALSLVALRRRRAAL